jgi:hypothetical protein
VSWNQSFKESVDAILAVFGRPVGVIGRILAVPLLACCKWLSSLIGHTELFDDFDKLKAEQVSDASVAIEQNHAKVAEAIARANRALDEEYCRRIGEAELRAAEAKASLAEADVEVKHAEGLKTVAESKALASDAQARVIAASAEAHSKVLLAEAEANAKLIAAKAEALERITAAVSKITEQGGKVMLSGKNLQRLINHIERQFGASDATMSSLAELQRPESRDS